MLRVAPDGVLWAGAGCTVTHFNDQTWHTVDPGCKNTRGVVLDIAFTTDGAVWIAGPFNLARFNGESWTDFDRMAHSLAVALDGVMWVSGWEGLQSSYYVGRFDGTAWTIHNAVELFREPVGKITVTPDGVVWGATKKHGVVRFDGQAWKQYTTADGLPSNRIIDFSVAPDGMVWAITDRGVARFGGDVWLPVNGISGGINVMAFAPDSSVWFGTSSGVVHYQP